MILLDFDGPVCALFSGLPAREVAARVRDALRDSGYDDQELPPTDDPLEVLARAGAMSPNAARIADTTLRTLELAAAPRAAPTPGVRRLLEAAVQRQISVAIVSNNSEEAVQAHLRHQGLSHLVSRVFGRPPGRPDLMKPSPYLLELAMASSPAERARTVMVGDSASDGLAARAAGVPFAGYANRPGKATHLRNAGALWIIDSLGGLAEVLALET